MKKRAVHPSEVRAAPRATLEALADAVAAEIRLLNEVGGLLRLQRVAVARSDLQGVEETVANTHRVLMTLSQARRLRVGLVKVLEVCIAIPERNPLRAEFDDLRRAALSLREDVETSRSVLRQAMEGSEDLIRMAYGNPAVFAGGEPVAASLARASRADGLRLKMTA